MDEIKVRSLLYPSGLGNVGGGVDAVMASYWSFCQGFDLRQLLNHAP